MDFFWQRKTINHCLWCLRDCMKAIQKKYAIIVEKNDKNSLDRLTSLHFSSSGWHTHGLQVSVNKHKKIERISTCTFHLFRKYTKYCLYLWTLLDKSNSIELNRLKYPFYYILCLKCFENRTKISFQNKTPF